MCVVYEFLSLKYFHLEGKKWLRYKSTYKNGFWLGKKVRVSCSNMQSSSRWAGFIIPSGLWALLWIPDFSSHPDSSFVKLSLRHIGHSNQRRQGRSLCPPKMRKGTLEEERIGSDFLFPIQLALGFPCSSWENDSYFATALMYQCFWLSLSWNSHLCYSHSLGYHVDVRSLPLQIFLSSLNHP